MDEDDRSLHQRLRAAENRLAAFRARTTMMRIGAETTRDQRIRHARLIVAQLNREAASVQEAVIEGLREQMQAFSVAEGEPTKGPPRGL